MPDVVRIARCPVHGLHGERDACFVCGGPVEQVAMLPLEREGARRRGGVDAARLAQLAELARAVAALPLAVVRALSRGPLADPDCGVCRAAARGEGAAVDEIRDYHDVSVITLAELVDEEDLCAVALMISDEAAPLIRALAGALSAERALTLYLLAGWAPPRAGRLASTRRPRGEEART